MYVCVVRAWVFVCTYARTYVRMCACTYVCAQARRFVSLTSEGMGGWMYWCLFQVSGLQVDRRIAGPYQGWNSRTK